MVFEHGLIVKKISNDGRLIKTATQTALLSSNWAVLMPLLRWLGKEPLAMGLGVAPGLHAVLLECGHMGNYFGEPLAEA